MPSKKKKYNARFPAGRIKKIMQSDEEIGKVAQAVPVIISRTLELFVESLLTKTLKITNSRNAKTLSPSHMKQCIMAENRFDFLRELVKNIPDISVAEEAVSNDSSPEATTIDPSDMPYDLSMPSTSNINNNNNSNTETSFQKLNPTNGGGAGALSLVRNNGVTRSCGTTVISNTFKSHQQPTLNNALNLGVSEENRDKLKRQWDVIGRSISQIQQDTTQHASTPPKLLRTDSAPAGIARTQQHPSTTITSARAQQKNQQQHHEQPNQQTLPTDLRRLRHQPKSVPGNHCTEKTTPAAAESHTNLNKPQTPKTVHPAPIVSIDFCNKPVIKIDYSNLALHTNISDVNYSESLSSSSSSPTVVEQPNNKSFIDKAVVKIQTPTITTTTPESPVINIDLSNIVTSGTFTTSSLHPSVLSPVSLPTASPVASSAVTTNKNSYLELDEDYDNI